MTPTNTTQSTPSTVATSQPSHSRFQAVPDRRRRRLEPDTPRRRRHPQRDRPAGDGRCDLAQRGDHRSRRHASRARRPVREPDRTVPTRTTTSRLSSDGPARSVPSAVSLTRVAKEWGRIGCQGFGGPPNHIVMLRELCVTKWQWLTGTEFEDACRPRVRLSGSLRRDEPEDVRSSAGRAGGGLCSRGRRGARS